MQAFRQIGGQAGRLAVRQVGSWAGRHLGGQAGRWVYRWASGSQQVGSRWAACAHRIGT